MIRDITDIPALPGGLPFDASQVQFTPAGAGAVARPVQGKERDVVSVFDFMTAAQIADVQARTLAVNVASAVQACWTYCGTIGATAWHPPGSYWLGTTQVVVPNFVHVLGAGKGDATHGTRFVSDAVVDAIQLNNTINGSTGAYVWIGHLWIHCTTRTAGKAAFADTASTFLTLDHVGVDGNDFGMILDQSEVADITDCDFELSSGSSTAGLWLVNGADRTGGASAQFTNRITVSRTQFNGTVGTGIVDDGGGSHHFCDNNFNALAKHIRVSQVNGLVIDGENEFENPTTTSIHFAATKLSGAAVAATTVATIGGNFFSSPAAIPLITYDASSLINHFLYANHFNNNNATGAPTSGIGNITAHFGFGNTQQGTGDATNTNLGNFLGSVGVNGISLRIGSRTLGASEIGLLNKEGAFNRIYVGDGSGFSLGFSKRTGSVTTDLVVFNDTGTVAAFTGNVTISGSLSPAGKTFPGTDAGVAQAVCGVTAGNGVPNNANGANGDFYFRGDGGAGTCIYQRRAGVWVATGA